MKPLDTGALYVGANYHPHDWDEARWVRDLDMMKEASLNLVRLGHLCWDSFEPEEGRFEFGWMDKVMDLCAERGIGVFLDIATRPAPTWLHKKYPSIDITDRSGVRQDPHTRYMEDVGDPHFREYAFRLAARLASRYGKHPALLAFGLCNELGAGFCSYSKTAEQRFIRWLRDKYGDVETLNRAWAGQRWSRKLTCFEDVVLPIGSGVLGAPERWLDMRRFYSDELLDYIRQLKAVVNENAPGVPVSMNHWAESQAAGFDYNGHYEELEDFSGQGFYPGSNPEDENALIGTCFCVDHRSAELERPNWNLEFQVGSFGSYACPRGAMRMYAYLSCLYGGQAVCAWTWRTMLGGEEQYLFGILDHDGEPSFKYGELRQIAEEAKRLEKQGLLPRKKQPEAAIAYSYESILVGDYAYNYYTVGHRDQALEAYKVFYHGNMDCSLVDLRHIRKPYKVLIVPGVCLMEASMAETVREQLEQGATVIVTAFSAKVDEHNQAFDTPLPGRLSELFGVKVRGFDRAVAHVPSFTEGGLAKQDLDLRRRDVGILMDGEDLGVPVNYHEFLELTTAAPLAEYRGAADELRTAVSCRRVGKGRAVYVGVPAQEELIRKLLARLHPELTGVDAPAGVAARRLDGGSLLYVNTTGRPLEVPARGRGFLSGKTFTGSMTLPGYDVEIVTG